MARAKRDLHGLPISKKEMEMGIPTVPTGPKKER